MATVAESSRQEYWRSPNPEVMRLVTPAPANSCWRCGADYPPAARFCHICGSERDPSAPQSSQPPAASSGLAPLTESRRKLIFFIASLVFFSFGIACIIVAGLIGIVYKADTLVDWQAIQLWRVEWLLAATAAVLAGIFLKRA